MAKISKPKLLQLINQTIPEPGNITRVQEKTSPNSISFNWRGLDFNVTTALEVTESGLHVTTCHSLLMQALLRETHANH
jgi:hypothetical protein